MFLLSLLHVQVLRTMGIEHICAVDGNEKRLEFAKRMGADTSVNFMNFKGIEALTEAVKEAQGGHLADFAFQCTGNPKASAISFLLYCQAYYLLLPVNSNYLFTTAILSTVIARFV